MRRTPGWRGEGPLELRKVRTDPDPARLGLFGQDGVLAATVRRGEQEVVEQALGSGTRLEVTLLGDVMRMSAVD